MLASLLPGLRDVRTPLAVGYIWMFNLWLLLGDRVVKNLHDGAELTSHIASLRHYVGQGAMLAGLSFAAFVIGSMATVRSDAYTLLWSKIVGRDRRSRSEQLKEFLADSLRDPNILDTYHLIEAQLFPVEDFRARLLIGNAEMYGEFDRFESEAVFRINICIPLFTLGLISILQVNLPWWSDVGVVILLALLAGIILTQGQAKSALADEVLLRAVVSGIIEHPIATRVHAFEEEKARARQERKEAEIERQRKARLGSEKRARLLTTLDSLESAHENLHGAKELSEQSEEGSEEEQKWTGQIEFWRRHVQGFRDDVLKAFDDD
ncbi:hypothetical protein AB0E69_02565 [Kribbella sp. NPDC026611]|uniref:hypothetical protein n=1 Tax=Kribbella sp. NPDC026611 TaxID=3154911 RepID=UPI0034040EAA